MLLEIILKFTIKLIRKVPPIIMLIVPINRNANFSRLSSKISHANKPSASERMPIITSSIIREKDKRIQMDSILRLLNLIFII